MPLIRYRVLLPVAYRTELIMLALLQITSKEKNSIQQNLNCIKTQFSRAVSSNSTLWNLNPYRLSPSQSLSELELTALQTKLLFLISLSTKWDIESKLKLTICKRNLLLVFILLKSLKDDLFFSSHEKQDRQCS